MVLGLTCPMTAALLELPAQRTESQGTLTRRGAQTKLVSPESIKAKAAFQSIYPHDPVLQRAPIEASSWDESSRSPGLVECIFQDDPLRASRTPEAAQLLERSVQAEVGSAKGKCITVHGIWACCRASKFVCNRACFGLPRSCPACGSCPTEQGAQAEVQDGCIFGQRGLAKDKRSRLSLLGQPN